MVKPEMRPDRLNEIGVLTRREVEARLVGPLLEAMGDAFGRQPVMEVARQVILQVARQQGEQIAEQMGGCSLAHLAASLEAWKKDQAMQMDDILQTEKLLAFKVTRCRYAEMYWELGMAELGYILSCSRDAALIEGFNPYVRLTRTQTIMEGAPFCDFHYRLEDTENESEPPADHAPPVE